MHKTDAVTLLAYNFWADNEILQACRQITPEQFTRAVTPDPGWHSLRGTLVHLLDTAYGWRAALQDLPDEGILAEEDFDDVEQLRARWQAEEAAWTAYIDGLSEAELNAVWGERDGRRRVRWETILHVINDCTHHRSEAAAMLTGYGSSPGDLDFEGYLIWRASAAAASAEAGSAEVSA